MCKPSDLKCNKVFYCGQDHQIKHWIGQEALHSSKDPQELIKYFETAIDANANFLQAKIEKY